MFMMMAEAASQRSTCYRRSVGAVIVQGSNVISIGYNGPKAGEMHCTGQNCTGSGGCARAVHAEDNAISRATVPLAGARMYVTESPCVSCANQVILNGISEVYYLNEYRIVEGIHFLIAAGVKVKRMTPSGYIIDYASNELVNGG